MKWVDYNLFFFMRVLLQKFHCSSFMCFCKPSPHFLSPSPLKLENSSYVPSTLSSVSEAVVQSSNEKIEVKKQSLDEKNQVENFPKSSLRKTSPEPGGDSKEVERGRVQWKDLLGKELVEIKEFEPSDSGDSDDEDDSNQSCACVIQ